MHLNQYLVNGSHPLYLYILFAIEVQTQTIFAAINSRRQKKSCKALNPLILLSNKLSKQCWTPSFFSLTNYLNTPCVLHPGTHWLWEVVKMLRQGQACYADTQKEAVMLEFADVDYIKAEPSPRTLNSHLPMCHLPRQIAEKKIKVSLIGDLSSTGWLSGDLLSQVNKFYVKPGPLSQSRQCALYLHCVASCSPDRPCGQEPERCPHFNVLPLQILHWRHHGTIVWKVYR